MSELEQLRKEVNELRERLARLARLEARKDRIEQAQWREYQNQRQEWSQHAPPPQPLWKTAEDMAKLFPPGTIIY